MREKLNLLKLHIKKKRKFAFYKRIPNTITLTCNEALTFPKRLLIAQLYVFFLSRWRLVPQEATLQCPGFLAVVEDVSILIFRSCDRYIFEINQKT